VKIGMMEAFKKLAVGPDALPDIIFASIGRTIWKVNTTQHTARTSSSSRDERHYKAVAAEPSQMVWEWLFLLFLLCVSVCALPLLLQTRNNDDE
jgi:hypothetical protein